MKTPRSVHILLTALAAPLALSGCSVFDKSVPPPCPPVYILSDASHLTKYRAGSGRDLTDVELEAEIVGFKGGCSYDEKGGEVILQLGFEVKRGPAAKTRDFQLDYFIAIPKFFPDPAAKAVFTVPVKFPEGMDVARTTDEEVSLRIPVKTKQIINEYEIYLGFQVTPEELELNRRAKH